MAKFDQQRRRVNPEAERRYRDWAELRAPQLHRTAYLLCGDWHLAEDLVQESFVRAAVHWARVEAMANADGWLYRVLVNEHRQRWRRRSNRESPSATLPETIEQDRSDDRAERDEIMAALSRLGPRQRAAVVLRYFNQLSEAETARVLDCSVGTVKSQTARGLAALRITLTHQEFIC
jgi:RNA polymerase sigma-70 factor (sigma-E family)